jgi:hypothetical protein
MLNDDQNRNDLNRNNSSRVDRSTGIGSGWMMLLAAAVVLGLLAMWAPWSNNHTASNNSPGTTTGSSTARPATPASPTAPATTPAAPYGK